MHTLLDLEPEFVGGFL